MTLRGRRPGDRRVRVELVKPQAYEVRAPRRIRRPPSPAVVLIAGFAVLIALGTVVLMLPISSAAGTWTGFVAALFTATSATCVTGLVVLDTATYWSPFGHVVILILIQVGGFGFMTGSTLLLFLVVGRRTGLRDRLLVQASTGVPDLGSVTDLVRRVAVFTAVSEVAGAVLLMIAFLGHGRSGLDAAWFGVFHSVSAFNNAGFDLMGNFTSLTELADDALLLGVIGVLIVVGGLGFAILGDAFGKRRWSRFALETKIVLATSTVLLIGGAIVIGALEWENPGTLGALPVEQRPINALFESATLRTAGFSSLSTDQLRDASLFVVMALMFIGGASGSTAGGIKVGTFSVLLIAIVSSVRGDPSATAFGRRISHAVVYRALSVALLSIAFVFVVGFGIEIATAAPFIDVLFEAVSAVGTVGASTGITPDLPDPARLLVIGAMFAGRLGPLTLVIALAARSRPVRFRPAVESVRIG
ncbi:MAG TPA: potassium transporter TrkG [Candidatus Limnocylindrales bacterium]|nr:potassium transporter TrkG [Candidatus Limnocylindrales bacterium]